MKNSDVSILNSFRKGLENVAEDAYESLNREFDAAREALEMKAKEEYPTSWDILKDILITSGVDEMWVDEIIMASLYPNNYWNIMALYKRCSDKLEGVYKLNEDEGQKKFYKGE